MRRKERSFQDILRSLKLLISLFSPPLTLRKRCSRLPIKIRGGGIGKKANKNVLKPLQQHTSEGQPRHPNRQPRGALRLARSGKQHWGGGSLRLLPATKHGEAQGPNCMGARRQPLWRRPAGGTAQTNPSTTGLHVPAAPAERAAGKCGLSRPFCSAPAWGPGPRPQL